METRGTTESDVLEHRRFLKPRNGLAVKENIFKSLVDLPNLLTCTHRMFKKIKPNVERGGTTQHPLS